MKDYKGKIKREFIDKALHYLSLYKSDKEELKNRIILNQRWYEGTYAKWLDEKDNKTRPASSYIFSAIENKYADAVDNFPQPNLIEREESDEETARLLSKIIPAELDMTDFKRVYKDNARRKLRYGTAIYGVFYNPDKMSIDITAVDILNIYCDTHLKDVQESQFLFIVSCIDNDILKEDYPEYEELFDGDSSVEGYSGSYTLEDRTEIIDCYYKKPDGTLHMMKLAGDKIIAATEDEEGYEKGLYAHGQYPVVFDVMYPKTDCPFGFSVIDIVRNIQSYVDELDGAILKNALLQSENRFIIKENSGLNIKDFLDVRKAVLMASGDISNDAIRQIEYKPVSEYTLNHRETKKQELKEIIGNRDFQQGGTSGGVTAASAIMTLQSAGEKLSRAMCDDSYDAYKDIVRQAIELIREFYDEEKVYRIVNDRGMTEYKSFDNSMLIGERDERDALGFIKDTVYRRVEFDIEIVPQRENPFSRESGNQTMMTLWEKGVLLADNVRSGASSIILQAMNFDGKEKILSLVEEYKEQLIEQEQAAMQEQAAIPETAAPAGNEEPVPINTTSTDGNFSGGGQLENPDDELVPIDLNKIGQLGGYNA